MTSPDSLNQKKLFNDLKEQISELDSLKSDANFEKTRKQIVESLRSLDKYLSDKKKFSSILYKIENNTFTEVDILALKNLLSQIETKNLTNTELQKIKEIVDNIKSTRSQLNQLKSSISLTNFEEKKEELEKKIKFYKEKLEDFSKEHPIWTKALILLLPAKLAVLFKKKESSNNEDVGDGTIKDVLNKFLSSFSVITDVLAQIATVFFWWFAPKEMKDLLKKMKEDFWKIDSKLLEKVGGGKFSDIELAPEKIVEAKDKLLNYIESKATDWFDITGKDEKTKFRVVLNKWWDWIKYNDGVNSFLHKILNWEIKLSKLGIGDIIDWLGVWFKGAFSLLSLMYEEKLISLPQLGLKLLHKWGDILLESALFFKKAIGASLGIYSLEDVYNFINTNNLIKDQKDMFMVMIYRAINTPPFSLLQHIAALPFYALSAAANATREIKSWKMFIEALKWDSITNQLKLLEKIEEEVTDRKWHLYELISEATEYYKKWIVVSYAYSVAKNDVDKFKEILKKYGLPEDTIISLTKKDLSDKTIANFVDNMASNIRNLDETYGKSLPEAVKVAIGWVVWETNLFKQVVNKLSTALKDNSEMFKKWKIFDFYRRWTWKVKFAIDSAGNVKLLDYIHFTWDVKDFKDFTEDLRQLAVHSPDIVKFLFRNGPVIILWKDIINAFKKGDNVAWEIAKIYAEFIPIVGPIMFFNSSEKKDLSIRGTTGVWLWLDIWWVFKVKPKNLLKLAAMPAIETAQFIWNTVDILSRYKFAWKTIEKLSTMKLKWKLAIAAGILLVLYGMYKYITDDNEFVNTLANIAKQSGWVEAVNEYIVNNWKTFDEEEKKQLIIAFIGQKLWLTPDLLEKYIDDVDIFNGKVTLHLTDEWEKAPVMKEKLRAMKPIIQLTLSKLGYPNDSFKIAGEESWSDNIKEEWKKILKKMKANYKQLAA